MICEKAETGNCVYQSLFSQPYGCQLPPREAREQKITLNVITYIMIPNCIHSAKKVRIL